jgi:hypothetical protein
MTKHISIVQIGCIALVIALLFVVIQRYSSTPQQLIICTPPFMPEVECGKRCNATCAAASFYKGEPVCFECL